MSKLFSLILVFIISLFNSQNKKVFNKIDSLNSTEDIQKFILNEDNKINYYLNVENKTVYNWYCGVIADSIKIKQAWQKADFDNNGLTDILVTGKTSEGPKTICIIDKGDYFETKKINLGNLYEECSFSFAKNNKIEYHSIKIINRFGYISNLIKQNLIYKNGNFIEENLSPKRHNILEIKFENPSTRWQKNPLKIEIISNRDITWISKNDELLMSGVYLSKLSQEKYKEIVDVLNYINFENLEDEYEVGYSDASTTYLEITYDNFKVKKIQDNGGMGTRGLKLFYDMLIDLKLNQEWVKQ